MKLSRRGKVWSVAFGDEAATRAANKALAKAAMQ